MGVLMSPPRVLRDLRANLSRSESTSLGTRVCTLKDTHSPAPALAFLPEPTTPLLGVLRKMGVKQIHIYGDLFGPGTSIWLLCVSLTRVPGEYFSGYYPTCIDAEN